MTYPVGATLVFVDSNATVSDDEPHLCEGVVSGDPVMTPDGKTYVPVFAERDGGREATTIFVAASNVMGEA